MSTRLDLIGRIVELPIYIHKTQASGPTESNMVVLVERDRVLDILQREQQPIGDTDARNMSMDELRRAILTEPRVHAAFVLGKQEGRRARTGDT